MSWKVGVRYLVSEVPGIQSGTQKEDGQVGRWEYSTLRVQYMESTGHGVRPGTLTEDG